MDCEECCLYPAAVHCVECEESLCHSCDEFLHRRAKRRSHLRTPLCPCGATSENSCLSCSAALCSGCHHKHSGHIIEPLLFPSRLGLYWDLATCAPSSGAALRATLTEIGSVFSEVASLSAYAESPGQWRSELEALGFCFRVVAGMKAIQGLLIDVSLDASRGFTHVVLLSRDVPHIRSSLHQLQDTLPSLRIQFSNSVEPLNLHLIDEIPTYSLLPPEEFTTPGVERFPVKQPVVGNVLTEVLRDRARAGIVIHEKDEFLREVARELGRRIGDLVLDTAHTHCSEKVFANGLRMQFLSLRLESLSLESFLWALKSLQLDQMLPTERAIQSRVKEAFDYKASPIQWQQLMDSLKRPPHSSEFLFSQFTDPVTGLQAIVVYPRGSEWISLDQKVKEGDSLRIKQTREWGAFTRFLDVHFLTSTGEIDESRAIAGGRYGCAQFLKFCGTSVLKQCSLGRLSYMVQLAINEDSFRYQRTLLIWTPISLKQTLSAECVSKLQVVKETVISLLRESKGMSLAQLPLNLRRKLPFQLNVNELGFPKLKDLLMTMPTVSVELRGPNHPYAVFTPEKAKTTGEVKNALRSILENYQWGLPHYILDEYLKERLGPIHWAELACSSLLEFLAMDPAHCEVLPDNVVVLRPSALLQRSEASTDHSKSSSIGSDTRKNELPRAWAAPEPPSESGVVDFEEGALTEPPPIFGVYSRRVESEGRKDFEPPPGL